LLDINDNQGFLYISQVSQLHQQIRQKSVFDNGETLSENPIAEKAI